jgi:alkaline phosphatase D
MTSPLFPLPGADRPLNRRSFLLGSASFAAAALLSTRARGAVAGATTFPAYPFSWASRSGDPTPDGVVCGRVSHRVRSSGGECRGAGRGLVAGRGGRGDDARCAARHAAANPAWAHAVHVEVAGLRPDRWYWYQFKAGSEVSPRPHGTMPSVGALAERLRFAVASCQKYEIGYYTAYEHMAREDLDLVVHLGDYIYEKGRRRQSRRRAPTRHAGNFHPRRLPARYARYKSDPALQAVHAMGAVDRHLGRPRGEQRLCGCDPEHPDGSRRRISCDGELRVIRRTSSTCRFAGRRCRRA